MTSEEMKLHRVNIEIEMYVVADDEKTARKIGIRELRQDVQNEPFISYQSALEVKNIASLPKKWVNAIPYSNIEAGKTHVDDTCAQWIARSRLRAALTEKE